MTDNDNIDETIADARSEAIAADVLHYFPDAICPPMTPETGDWMVCGGALRIRAGLLPDDRRREMLHVIQQAYEVGAFTGFSRGYNARKDEECAA